MSQTPDNMRGCGEVIVFSLILAVGMTAGAFITFGTMKSAWEQAAVESGHADYHPHTGKWRWKQLTPEKPEAPDAR